MNITYVSLVSATSNLSSPPIIDQTRSLLQVVITEVVFNNGVIEFQSNKLVFEEKGDVMIIIPVLRHSGFDGSVGAYYELASKNISTEDVKPLNGIIMFSANETLRNITFTMNNDEVPELTEYFMVELTKPLGGVKLGEQDRVEVIIEANDHPFGLIGYVLVSLWQFKLVSLRQSKQIFYAYHWLKLFRGKHCSLEAATRGVL